MRPQSNKQILHRLQQHEDEIAITAIVWHELLFGCQRLPPSARRTATEAYLYDVLAPSVPIVPYDARAAQWHAAECARLTSEGKTPPFVDGQIAAVASVNGLVLVTLNQADFVSFQNLSLEDWRE